MSQLLIDSHQPEAPPSTFSVADIVQALFKHKWKILLGAILGLVAAFTVQNLYTPVYESHAKLLVRYVLERTPIDSVDATSGKTTDNVLGSEVEILTSWDLALQVAEAVGPKRLLPGVAVPNKVEAAGVVSSGVRVAASRGSNIIIVSYTNPDPQLAVVVLDELLSRYFTKHLEVHRSAGAFDFVTQQTDQVRSRLNETEDALKALKSKAGIINVADSTASLSVAQRKTEQDLYNAEEELAGQRLRIAQMENADGATPKGSPAGPSPAKGKDIERYKTLAARLGQLRQYDLELKAKYTGSNRFVTLNEKQIAELEKQKSKLEDKFPDIAQTAPEGEAPITLAGEKARLAAMEMKTESLKARLANIREGVKKLADVGSQMADLERNQELEIANYKYFKSTLEKARIDEALDPSKMPNISTVQRPSPPSRFFGKRDKVVRYLALSGVGLVVGLVLLKELLLNQTVKRSRELENRLGTRLLVSIPSFVNGAGRRLRLPWKKPDGGADGNEEEQNPTIAPWAPAHFIRPYAAAIRDRLGLFFELTGVTHKPKLIGVTGFREGAGISTLAAGLAASLSEMGDGKVLLVDVNLGLGEVHPFFNGKPALPLTAALAANGSLPATSDNLYLATVGPSSTGVAQLGLKKFFDLMPNLHASDFDYVVFDMPPLGQTSPTLGMAGFMDKLLLVVDAEKTNRDVVKRGYEALTAGRDNVEVVFNKARSYSPNWLHSDS